MKLFILVLVLFSGCASIQRNLYKEDFEKALPYREGETVVLEIGDSNRIEVNEQVRFGFKSRVSGIIQNVPVFDGQMYYDIHKGLQSKAKAIVKVTMVDRDCEATEYNTVYDSVQSCKSRFEDEFEFVQWDQETQAAIDKVLTQRKLKADAEAKEADQLQKLVLAQTARCKPFFDKYVSIQKRIKKMAPRVAEQVIASGASDEDYLKRNKDGSTTTHNDQDDELNRLTAPIQQEMKSLVMNRKYTNCPGSAHQTYTEEMVSPDPREASLDD